MTAKTLIIAEKPSVAGDLTKVLPGKFKKTKTHFESDSHIVSYAIGHLVAIQYPEEIDPKYKSWSLSNLPIIPDGFPLKGLQGTKGQLNALQKLIRRKDVTEIINACDAGREGELIFKYIIRYVWNKSVARKSFKRLWLQSMTRDAIKEAFANLRDNEEMHALEDAALCRSESDWLIGLNATRALTGFNSRKGGFFLTPCGRVQTPTLSLLVKREQFRLAFEPRDYYKLQATFSFADSSYTGKWINPDFRKDPDNEHARNDRIWEEAKASELVAKCTDKPAIVTETSKKSSQRAPALYDLTSLQREANGRFGFSAKNTLSIAQALYERHKVLTYPRTDSRHLPEDYLANVKKTIKLQQDWQMGVHARTALEKGYVKKEKRIFDNKKISDHHAIIPTNKLPGNLSEAELKIYTMVVQRFLAVFFPPARYLNTKRLSVVSKETFLTEGKIQTDPGWKIIYQGNTNQETDKLLVEIPKGTDVHCKKVAKEKLETKPPPRFNEATLLSAMEHSGKFVDDEELAEAMKERGLGTPATRAAIIEKLLKEKYIVREGKELTPTGKAFELLSLLEALKIEVLASPQLTGEWEFKLNQILHGKLTRDKFMGEIRELTRHIISQIRNFEQSPTQVEAPFSPVDGVRFFETPTAYISEDEKISLRKILGGRIMSQDEIIRIIRGETLGPFSDFRSKRGKPFTASVRLTKNKIEFLFADSIAELDIEAIKKTEPLGLSPVDNTPVFETPAAYMSESKLDGDKEKGLQISKVILARAITGDHIRQLLRDGKTELITKFISRKKRPFDAYLLMNKSGKISFEFPPRKRKGQAKSNS
ncbi:MAG TPA: DNA topoisomerase III [Desulfobacterales bacterium]|nr:DNA topoisomerase III [Desulfobacterales bacterium]